AFGSRVSKVRDFLRRSDAIVGIVRDFKKMLQIAERRSRPRHIQEYLRANTTRKLQLGAGPTSLPGLLSTDVAPYSPTTVQLDATKRFPFENGVFDYIFTEHMIEHISWGEGNRMLQECHRVLRPGGIIRIATPDLAVLLDLYSAHGTPGKEL